MARGHARAAGTDARVIEIDTNRVLARKQRHFAVIDVGLNSIRLVVYDDLSQAHSRASTKSRSSRSAPASTPAAGCRARPST